jgi:hypothetical protein
LSGTVIDDDTQSTQGDDDDPAMVEDDEEDEEDEEGQAEDKDDEDDKDDNINELDELGEEERTRMLEETVVVRETVTKVSDSNLMNVLAFLLLTILYRFENFRLQSFTRPQLLSLLGAASAASCVSRNASSPVMS